MDTFGYSDETSSMQIFDDTPTDWNDLQDCVGQLFSELGCVVRVGERTKLVRGRKETDVLIVDPMPSPPSRYIVECKYWRSKVPQKEVHSFRTVMADSGAHRGFIVSMVGFQAGAYEAVSKTNINLCTFSELQGLFFDRWKAAIAARYMPDANRLFPFWDPFGKRVPAHWGPADMAKLNLLNAAYEPFRILGPSLASTGYTLWCLPLKLPILDDTLAVVGEQVLTSYRQFYDFIDANREAAVVRYKALFAERAEGSARMRNL